MLHHILAISLLFCPSSTMPASCLGTLPEISRTEQIYPEEVQKNNSVKLEKDGPYLFKNPDNTYTLLTVDSNNCVRMVCHPSFTSHSSFEVSTTDNHYKFNVTLQDPEEYPTRYPQPRKIFVLSDIHGEFNNLVTSLKIAKIIDDSLQWNFSNNHLVVMGDIVGSSKDCIPALWFIYKLEEEAKLSGGKVHFILGDGEVALLKHQFDHLNEKYTTLAHILNIDINVMWGPTNVLSEWLRAKNAIEIIGASIFVRGGISKELFLKEITLDDINSTIRKIVSTPTTDTLYATKFTDELLGDFGPIKYKGIGVSERQYHPISTSQLGTILKKIGVKQIVVGHFENDEILSRHNGLAVLINTHHCDTISTCGHLGLLITRYGNEVVLFNGLRRQLAHID